MMAEPKYFICRMGNLYHKSGKPALPIRQEDEESAQNDRERRAKGQEKPGPVLRLRPDCKDELQSTRQEEPRDNPSEAACQVSETSKCVTEDATATPQEISFPDGPWARHPNEICETCLLGTKDMRDDITIMENRERHKKRIEEFAKARARIEDMIIEFSITSTPAVNMTEIEGMDEELVDLSVERWFVNSHVYLQPGVAVPPSISKCFARDWAWNARGVYYRHYYSPEWVTGDHSLWIPTVDDIDWDDRTEETRRMRARTFLRHALNNEGWNKSEYAWEADAWADVFGQMRADPVITADKRKYYNIRSGIHAVSCVQTGRSKFMEFIPDATFGLATFQPKHYQNALASYDLDAERLQALTLHRNCGLLVDPRWGESNLVFPFAVYEAKGWNGDPREARRQACSAAAAYLDLLDALARHPGKPGKMEGAYQTAESRSSQVFALTSFGAHWHVMVGYRRPRLAREYAGRAGMSDTEYLFQRIWSGRITTERKAWELLSTIDQIHEWGVTTHRDFVIRHLKPWHEFCKRCHVHDAEALQSSLDQDVPWDGRSLLLELPAWTQHFRDDKRAKLKQTAFRLMLKAYHKYCKMPRQKSDHFSPMWSCVLEDCGPFGYPTSSTEETVRHYYECHRFYIDEEFRRKLDEYFRDELGEGADEKEVAEGVIVDDALKPCGMALMLPKRKGRGENEDGDHGPSALKKARL